MLLFRFEREHNIDGPVVARFADAFTVVDTRTRILHGAEESGLRAANEVAEALVK